MVRRGPRGLRPARASAAIRSAEATSRSARAAASGSSAMVCASNRSGSWPAASISVRPPASSHSRNWSPSTSGWNWTARCRAEAVGLDAQVVTREHGGVGRRQAPVVVELQPRSRRDQVRIRGVDRDPADLRAARVLHRAAERGSQHLRAEADPQHRHPGRVRPAQPGQFLVDPGAGLALVVHRAGGPEHDDVRHAVAGPAAGPPWGTGSCSAARRAPRRRRR